MYFFLESITLPEIIDRKMSSLLEMKLLLLVLGECINGKKTLNKVRF